MEKFKRVRAWWARLRAERAERDVDRARFEMEEALLRVDAWTTIYELRREEYERLSGTAVLPRSVTLQHEGKVS